MTTPSAPGGGISGITVFAVGIGAFLAWTGIRNVGVKAGLTQILHGQVPTQGPQNAAAVDTSSWATATASGTATATGGPGSALGAAIGAAGASVPAGLDPAGHSVADLQTYAHQLLAAWGLSGQWSSFNALVMSESGWSWDSVNPGGHGYNGESHAYGIPQALPPSKMASAGADWKTNGYTQLKWMMGYVHDRYGTPDAAWAFHRANNWY